MTKTVNWEVGDGTITAIYDGSGNGTITITSTKNKTNLDRSQEVAIKTTKGSKIETQYLLINQERIDGVDGGNAQNGSTVNEIDCELADSHYIGDKYDILLDGGNAEGVSQLGRNFAQYNNSFVNRMNKDENFGFYANSLPVSGGGFVFGVYIGRKLVSNTLYVTSNGMKQFNINLTQDVEDLIFKPNIGTTCFVEFPMIIKKGTKLIMTVEFTKVLDTEFAFRNVKIELGTEATDWTPAPEDL